MEDGCGHKMGFPDVWEWLCTLPRLNKWKSPLISLELCASQDNFKKFLLVAEKIMAPDCSAWCGTFSLVLGGDWPRQYCSRTLWVSNPCPLGSEESMQKKTLPLLLGLVEEILNRAPKEGCKKSFSKESNVLESMFVCVDPQSCKELCNFLFLCRFFWVCACDAPFHVGSLYFDMVGSSLHNIVPPKEVFKSLLVSMGADCEENFMRSLGYMYTKFVCLSPDQQSFDPMTYSYSTSGHCAVRAYAPILAMKNSDTHLQFQLPNTEDTVLQYVLSHQQVEAVIQLKYSVIFTEDCVEVEMNVDNVRCSVSQLAFGNTNGVSEERHFPSRVSLSLGPVEGAQVVMTSLNKSSANPVTEMTTRKILFNTDCYSKFPIYIKSMAAIDDCCNSDYVSRWRFEQSCEGNKGRLEWILYDNESGKEVASAKPSRSAMADSKAWFKDRYRKATRPFTAESGVVFASDKYGHGVMWRMKKDCEEERVLKWNVRGCIWLSYWPNIYKTSYCETRYLELCEQVDLIVPK